MKKQTNSEEIEKIKKMLPRAGAYQMIETMINGAYKANTIRAMLNGSRTMKTIVFEAAKKLAETINPINTIENEDNE